jgi:heme-degrading monooxygenase HmoA
MVARVTLAEIDTVRMSLEDAIERFEELVLPGLREEEGYEGVYVLTTPEGKALVMSLWDSAEDAERTFETGFYQSQVEKFLMLFQAPPGRERYDVAVVDTAAPMYG